jgi:hypothetical protein
VLTNDALTLICLDLLDTVLRLEESIGELQELSHLHDRPSPPLPGQEPLFSGTGADL